MKVTDIEIIRRESLKRQMELWNARKSSMWIFGTGLLRLSDFTQYCTGL